MNYDTRWQELLRPSVKITTPAATGSGTMLFTKEGPDGWSSYILTNHHVVDDLIKVEEKWSTLLKRNVKMDIFGIPSAILFEYKWLSRTVGGRAVECDIMTYDKDEDLALLKMRSGESVPAVAKLYPRGQERELRLTMPVFTVGAGMGEPPVITYGMLAQFGKEIEHKEFWCCTAPSIFGNSGGATFLADTNEFIGVPARIAVRFGGDAVTHLSYIIPITRVYNFLEAQLFRFIYDPSFTEEAEAKERILRRKAEEAKLFRGEQLGAEQK